MLTPQPAADARLAFVTAARVDGPDGSLTGTVVRSRGGNVIGVLDGVLVDTSRARVACLVVHTFATGTRAQHLLPVGTVLPCIESHRGLRLDIEEEEIPSYDASSHLRFPALSHADLIAQFSRPR